MKYIKTYENNTPLYKKYIVTDFSPYHSKESTSSSYYIFKVLPNSTEDILYYDAYYYLSDDSDKKVIGSEDRNYYHNYKNKIFDIIYQTNSFKKASDFLYAVEDTNKFNL